MSFADVFTMGSNPVMIIDTTLRIITDEIRRQNVEINFEQLRFLLGYSII
jgi:hypothetical protein